MKKNLSFKYQDVFILKNYFRLLLFLLILIFFGVTSQNALAGQPAVDSSCCKCHTDICEDDRKKNYIHPPFLQQKCSFCHVYDDTEAKVEEESDNSSTNKITWLGYRLSHSVEHWLVIPFDLVRSNNLILCINDFKGNSHRKTMLLPAIETLQLKINDIKPPVIESVEVVGVYRGAMTTARIGWLTDKESDSEIRYGLDTLQHSVKTDSLTNEHEIILQNLKANQKYRYIVISQDIFGNKVESDMAILSTETHSPQTPEEYKPYRETDFLFDTQFFRNDDSYIMKFTANLPAIVSVGTQTINKKKKITREPVIVKSDDHLLLRSRDELLSSVCIKCHAGYNHNGNHKINVRPTKNVTIPVDYLMSSDGCITCVTCHASHASANEARLRFRYTDGQIKAGSYANAAAARAEGGCFVCHADKGISRNNQFGKFLISG